MWLQKSHDVCYDINAVQLKLLAYGHAALSSEEWHGVLVSPMYSRLYYILGGDPYIVVDGKKSPLEIGKCYLLPTGYSLSHGCENEMEQLYFHVNLCDSVGKDLLSLAKMPLEYIPEPRVVEMIREYIHSDELMAGLKLRQEVYNALYQLFEKYGICPKVQIYSECVRLAIEYINSRRNLRITIGELSANSFVSESTLSKKFRAQVGVSVGKYIDDTVMLEAEQLLINSTLSVLEITERLGFCDQFYFSRRFKKKYGNTPQKYRKLKLI